MVLLEIFVFWDYWDDIKVIIIDQTQCLFVSLKHKTEQEVYNTFSFYLFLT